MSTPLVVNFCYTIPQTQKSPRWAGLYSGLCGVFSMTQDAEPKELVITANTKPALLFIELFKRAVEVRNGFIDFSHLPAELVCVKQDASAASAGQITVTLYPSDAFIDFAMTVLALNFDGLVVENPHVNTPI